MAVPDLTILLTLTLLFVLLSPGILLTLPPPSLTTCRDTYFVQDCTTLSESQQEYCHQCQAVWNSSFTNRWAIALHTLVYIVLGWLFLIVLPQAFGTSFAGLSSVRTFGLLVLAGILFFALSPGMIVTLPPNSQQQCQNNLGIDPNHTKNCEGVWASSFTSGPAVLFHGLVFLLVLLWISWAVVY